MPNKFTIEYFTPKHLRKADKLLGQHLEEAKAHQEAYKKTLSRKNSVWYKVKKLLHLA